MSTSIEALLAAGADVNAKNKRGNTALHWAAGNGHVPAIEALLAAGAEPDVKNRNGNTPLDVAIGQGGHAAARVEAALQAAGQ